MGNNTTKPTRSILFTGITHFLFPLLLLACTTAQAQERITSFDSWIDVKQSGVMTVVETISVVAEGKQIKRGIYRDFPTDYKTPSGNRIKVDFTVLSVQRDGQQEQYHTKQMSNGTRVYIGNKNVFLQPGAYTYTLTYQTDRQIGFFTDYDELYWNVTGNDWSFPIEQASATVVLPAGAPILQYKTYTGLQGSGAADAEITDQSGNQISFRTTRPLAQREGLTIAVAWSKGFVKQPDIQDKAAFFLRDNLTVAATTCGLLILFLYYFVIWSKVGRDPEPEAIIPRFDPPEDFTPAAARFIMTMGFDNKTFTCAVVSMAVKKYLLIDDDQGTFSLERIKTTNPKILSRGERKVAQKLFSGSDRLELEKSNHKTISTSLAALENSLEDDFEAIHFKRNSAYMIPGLAITLLIVLTIFLTSHDKAAAGFMSFWLSIWSLGCVALIHKSYTAWKTVWSGKAGILGTGGALFTTLFAIPFIIGWFGGMFLLNQATSLSSIISLIAVLSTNLLFYYLLKAPTIRGRRIMDQLEGLKLYLSVAEKDRLNMLNPPEKTPELFERYLPWALALDVEQEWCEEFNEVLEQARQDGSYAPVWYHSSHPFSSSGLASSLGPTLSSTISSSSTAPGSSSSSGGGGFSGGGGGGGGGGGW